MFSLQNKSRSVPGCPRSNDISRHTTVDRQVLRVMNTEIADETDDAKCP